MTNGLQGFGNKHDLLISDQSRIPGEFLLYHYSFLCFTRGMLWSTDLILKHLTIANSLVILSKGIPQTMAAFGLKDTESDIGCKLVFYGHRVGRAV